MPDLGPYAGAILSAYGGSLLLLIAIVLISVWQAHRVQRQLTSAEERWGRHA